MTKSTCSRKILSLATAVALLVLTVLLFCISTASAQTVTESSLSATHELLDWKPQKSSYWNSTNSTSLAVGSTSFEHQFIASSVKFTKEQIPVGSVIFVDSGYKYRPEGWQTASSKNSGTRPDYVSSSPVTVDEAWWGNYTLRAFNLQSTTSGVNLADAFDTAKKALRIYIPKKDADKVFTWTVGYYESTYNSVIHTDSELASIFVASQIFTRDTLPVGSVITIDSGYKYRPEGWVSLDKKNTSRPDNVTTASVTVTEEWWGDYNYRAFNISTTAQGVISDNYLEVASHFNITLPDGTKISHPKVAPTFEWTVGF